MNGLSQRTVCMPLIRICLFKIAQWVSVVHAWSDCAYGPRNSRTVLRVAGRPVVLPPVRPRTPLCQRTHANGCFPFPFCFGNFRFRLTNRRISCHLCEFSVSCFVCQAKTVYCYFYFVPITMKRGKFIMCSVTALILWQHVFMFTARGM